MSNDDLVALACLQQELDNKLIAPDQETIFVLRDALRRLRSSKSVVEPVRINCLLTAAILFYHQGEQILEGVEPAAEAVMLARELGDRSILRRALNLHGLLLATTDNVPDALRVLLEALELSETLGDPRAEASVWNNIGVAFYTAAMYSDARQSYTRAAALLPPTGRPDPIAAMAMANAAMCCLHLNAHLDGIKSVKAAIALMPRPTSPPDILARVITEGTHVRLLLQGTDPEGARERARAATSLASLAGSVRAEISAACSEALVDVFFGDAERGLARGAAALERARLNKASLRETLVAMMHAYEQAGATEKALAIHRELTLEIQRAQRHSVTQDHDSDAGTSKMDGHAKLLSLRKDMRRFLQAR